MLRFFLYQVADLDCPDADVGDTVTYAILSGNTANVFSIDVNGVLKTATRELNNIWLILIVYIKKKLVN